MTIEELNQLAYLEKAIELEQRRLETLEESLGLKSPVISDMPKAPGAKDKIGETVPKIVDQQEEIRETIERYTELRERLLRFINKTVNAKMRMILIMRFVDQKSWQDIAAFIGGKETEYSVKQSCYRYIEGRGDSPIPGQISMFELPAT